MSVPVKEEPHIVRVETRFSTHVKRTEFNDDAHYVKEQVTYSDGTQKPRSYLIRDFVRPAYVTAKNFRNHREKKEFEDLDKLVMKETTDSDIDHTYAMMLDQPHLATHPRKLNESPYTFAKGLTAANFIKLASLKRNNFLQSSYTVASLDLEWNIYTDHILVGSITMREGDKIKIHCCCDEEWLLDHPNYEREIQEEVARWLPDYKDKLIITTRVFSDQVDLVKDLFMEANKWAPDFLDVWNIEADLGNIILPLLKRRRVDPIDVICDQRVPREYRRFEFTRGPNIKVMASGKEDSISPADRWHKFYSTSTFQLIDGMCCYRSLRIHGGRDTSYSLDAVLDKELKSSKLVVPGTENMSTTKWHIYMQKHRKITYIVYNFVDNIRLLELDELTGDLARSVPAFAEMCDFNDFKSSEKKSYCSLFIYGIGKNKILGTGANMKRIEAQYAKDTELEGNEVYQYEVLGIDDWIQTLPQGNTVRNGLRLFVDYPLLVTNARGNVVDLDSVSSYPSCIMAANVSKETCFTELIEIKGIEEHVFRAMNLGVVVINANTIEYCEQMLGLPSPDDLLWGLRNDKYGHIFKKLNIDIKNRKQLNNDIRESRDSFTGDDTIM